MSSIRNHVPLAVITIVLSVAIYIVFKELRAVKTQAALGAQFATAFQEQQQQQQQQFQMFQQMPPQFLVEPPVDSTPTAAEAEDTEDGAIEDLDEKPVKPKTKLQRR